MSPTGTGSHKPAGAVAETQAPRSQDRELEASYAAPVRSPLGTGFRAGFPAGFRRMACGMLAGMALSVAQLVAVGGLLEPVSAAAQNFHQRVIQGRVVDDTGSPLAGATVFLKNVKTYAITSATSMAAGSFHFAQVGMVDDYQLWAEKNGKKSAVKTVSSFDARKLLEYELKVK